MAICVAAKNVNEYCFYSEMSLKNVVHLRILGNVLQIYYMALIFFNESAKYEKYIIILKNMDISNFTIVVTAKSVNKYCFYSEVLLKSVVHLRILGKVLKSNYIDLIFFNVSTKI